MTRRSQGGTCRRNRTTSSTITRAGARQASQSVAPEKVIYPLEHAYSPAELEFGKLTGVDAAVAALLKSATPQADCDLHLAVLSIGESGSAEYTGSYRRRYRS